jgi:hypothetical protein
MQPGEAGLDWEEDEVRIIVLPAFEDRAWWRAEEGVLFLTAFASFTENGCMLNVVYWDMSVSAKAEVTKTNIKIAVVNEK